MSQVTPDETLLGLLAARSRHGYELLDCFSDPAQLGEVWHLSTSQLYAVLKRLETQKLIDGQQVVVADAPTRTEYALTKQGQTHLDAWLQETRPSPSIRRVRVEFLSRLYIARLLNLPTAAIVECQKRVCREKQAELVVCLEQSAPGIGRLTLELVVQQMGVILQWLDRCELAPRSDGDS